MRWRRFGTHHLIRSTRFPNLCLGIQPGGLGDAATVLLYQCPPPLTNGSAPWNLPTSPRREQLWDLSAANSDALEIRNVATLRCLDDPGDARAPGAVLGQAACLGGNLRQRFFLNVDRFEGGTHRLASFSDPRQCADVAGGATADGTPLLGFDCHGRENQQFEMLRVGSSHNQQIARGLGSQGLGCVSGPADASSPAVVQRQCVPDGAQQWLFRFLPSGTGYRARSLRDSNMCLTRPDGSRSGDRLVEARCIGAQAGNALWSQRWIVQ